VLDSPSLAESLIGERSTRVLTVYLPEAYDSSSDSFAVIYWFPGFNGMGLPFRMRARLDQAIEEGYLQSVIVVGFDLQTAYGGSFLLNSRIFGRWEDFVVDEAVPYLDASYRTIPSPQGRIAMGTSVGGWSALMLSVLHPGVWGSVGADDPSVWLMWDYVSDSDSFPRQSSWQDIPSSIKQLPESLAGLPRADIEAMTITVLGGTLSPDPEMPLGFAPPMTADGDWNPSVRKQWQAYNLAHAIGLARHGDALRALSLSIATTKDSTQGNAGSILDLASIWEQSGISTEVIRISGAHTMSAERFFALASCVLQTRQAKPQGSADGTTPKTITWD
jgi:pimeloyl-ACP methyl ester carboxylesterase